MDRTNNSTVEAPQAPVPLACATCDRTQPWRGHWPLQDGNMKNADGNKVRGFEKGEKIFIGGQAGCTDFILYDTEKN
ncbi:hypothetical protein BX600DRAFT_57272 [Xylariales sp. PMI_506]|nr:hypothetical protein BX600DRAFT_57272 [Xylariales sp. PMI_506]